MTSEITNKTQGLNLLKKMIDSESIQTQFQRALGENKDAFAASIVDLYTNDAQLSQCDPKAILCEALKAATLKLPLNKALGFSYVVVYKTNVKQPDGKWAKVPTPTFVMGFKGFIQLAMRTGQYKTINADVVYEGELVSSDKLTGDINLTGRKVSDKVIGYFCHFALLNGFAKTLYMSVEDMANYARKYAPSIPADVSVAQLKELAQKAPDGKKVGWLGNFNDMAIKTCVRRLLNKYGYLSIEMQSAISEDISSEASRNETISDNANSKVISLDVDYEPIKVTAVDDQPQGELEADPGY